MQFSFAQLISVTVKTNTTTTPNISNKATNTAKYTNFKLPKFGTMTRIRDANFEMFPKQINVNNYFATSSNASSTLLAISRKWQTACLYNASGTVAVYNGLRMCFQVGTGQKKDRVIMGKLVNLQTPLGLYTIQSKKDKDYASQLFTSTGIEIKPEDFKKEELKNKSNSERNKILGLAPMPYAMHIGKVIWLENNVVRDAMYSDGTAIHERQSVSRLGTFPFVSHGCVALPKNYGKYLQNSTEIGSMVMIFEEDMPNNLEESMKMGIMSIVQN